MLAALLWCPLATAAAGSPATVCAQEPLPDRMPAESPGTVDYRMDVRLSGDGRTIRGTLEADWRNDAPVACEELRWHVYNNAWIGRDSLWMREARLHGSTELPWEWGGTEVSDVVLVAGEEQTPLAWEYLPQPGAPGDRTVARTALPEPVPSGATVTVRLHFEARMPRAFRRSGFGGGGYVHAVQWFPKLGVFEEREGRWAWNCPPYHYLTEYYADYGGYDVRLRLPARYEGQVVATGSVAEGWPRATEDGSVEYRFLAADVHDFAWTADPAARVIEREFQPERWRDEEEERLVARALGRPVEELRPPRVKMILMLQPEHGEYEDRYFEAIAKSIYYFGLWYGPYPYPTITCVDPPHDARATGGMEYPRLFTGGAREGNAERTLSPERVTVHEFGHQYWYGLVGNDEFRDAWMDEGFNTFSTQRVLARGWPPALETYDVLGLEHYGRAPLRLPSYGRGDARALLTGQRWESPELRFAGALSLELRRRHSLDTWVAELPPATYLPRVERNAVHRHRTAFDMDWGQPIAEPTWSLAHAQLRRVNAYRRPAMVLETMARLMGEERWIRLIRAYHERWRFRHPRPDDFFDVVREFATGAALGEGEDAVVLNWESFWRQAYHGNEMVDYGVHFLRNLPAVQDPTLTRGEREVRAGREDGDAADARGPWDVVLLVRRYGGFRVPVEVRVTWEDGSVTDLVWDGEEPAWTWKRQGSPQRAVRVEVDPRRRLMLDRNWLNDARRAEPDRARAWNLGVRAMLWAQQVLHYAGGTG